MKETPAQATRELLTSTPIRIDVDAHPDGETTFTEFVLTGQDEEVRERVRTDVAEPLGGLGGGGRAVGEDWGEGGLLEGGGGSGEGRFHGLMRCKWGVEKVERK